MYHYRHPLYILIISCVIIVSQSKSSFFKSSFLIKVQTVEFYVENSWENLTMLCFLVVPNRYHVSYTCESAYAFWSLCAVKNFNFVLYYIGENSINVHIEYFLMVLKK